MQAISLNWKARQFHLLIVILPHIFLNTSHFPFSNDIELIATREGEGEGEGERAHRVENEEVGWIALKDELTYKQSDL